MASANTEASKAFTRKVLSDVDQHLRTRKVHILLLGPDLSKRDAGARLRRRLIELCNLEQLGVKPEHREILAAIKGRLRGGFNLTRAEEHIARNSHIIVIIPASAGSLAELGYFALQKHLCPRMVILFHKKFLKERDTYIAQGPKRAAIQSRAVVRYIDYRNTSKAWSILRREIDNARAEKADPTS